MRIEACHEVLTTGGTRFFGSDLLAGLLGATMTLDVFVGYVTTDLLFVNEGAQRFSLGNEYTRLRRVSKNGERIRDEAAAGRNPD